jgi:hypothetical protein
MAINKNHEFEELNGIKCAVVEKNAGSSRVDFLKELLEYNGYTVVVQATPLPKAPPAPAPTAAATESMPEAPAPEPIPVAPETFTIGVTDVMFNPTNAIFGRLLKTRNGHIVTLAYWNQKEDIPKDAIPYYENLP